MATATTRASRIRKRRIRIRFWKGSPTPIGFRVRRIACRSSRLRNPVLTVVPGFVRYPPELAYPPVSHTNEPAVVLREEGPSRLAWISGDVERTYWITGDGDMLRLLHNTIRWITRDERVVSVDGPGFIEMFAWETGPGYAIHLLNYSNANAFHGWLQSVEPLGRTASQHETAGRSAA